MWTEIFSYDIALLLGEEGRLNFLQFLYVGKKLLGVDKIFVGVVEIVDNHVAPENELVERGNFAAFRLGNVCVFVVEGKQKVHSTGFNEIAHIGNEIADGSDFR